MFLMNESKYLDLLEWLDTLEEIGVDVAAAFPKVAAMNERGDRITSLQATAANEQPAVEITARRLGLNDNLDDAAAIITLADHVAYAQNPDHLERVSQFFARAADAAYGEAIRIFKRSDILGALRPIFNDVAARITATAEKIPTAAMGLEDAVRLGHADPYMQLERDMTTWANISTLLGDLMAAGVLKADTTRMPAEFMLEDVDAFRDACAGSPRLARRAHGIAAGRPNLHTPKGAALRVIHDDESRRASYLANDADQAARASLGLVSR